MLRHCPRESFEERVRPPDEQNRWRRIGTNWSVHRDLHDYQLPRHLFFFFWGEEGGVYKLGAANCGSQEQNVPHSFLYNGLLTTAHCGTVGSAKRCRLGQRDVGALRVLREGGIHDPLLGPADLLGRYAREVRLGGPRQPDGDDRRRRDGAEPG